MSKVDVYKMPIKDVIYNGIWYFNRLGKVGHLCSPDVNRCNIHGIIGKKHLNFSWSDYKNKFWLTEEEAQKHADRYLAKALKYVSPKVLKQLANLKKVEYFYEKDKDRDYISSYKLSGYSNHDYYDKHRLAYIQVIEYDDDWGGGFREYEYPLKDYGKTWSFDREDLER